MDSDHGINPGRNSQCEKEAGLLLRLGRDEFLMDGCGLFERVLLPGRSLWRLFHSGDMGNLLLGEDAGGSMYFKREKPAINLMGAILAGGFVLAVWIVIILLTLEGI